MSTNTDIEHDIPSKNVVALRVIALGFSDFVKAVEGVSASNDSEFNVTLQRARVKAQVRGVKADGSLVELDDVTIGQLPAPVARKIIPLLYDEGAQESGKVLGDGDGVGKPVIFSLGTPITSGGEVIRELEFQARTFGEIERVLAEPTSLPQTLALVAYCAKPIHERGTLQRLPESDLAQLTLVDGTAIMRDVLPRFLA